MTTSASPRLSFNAPAARVPGEETPLFFGILRGRVGQAPLLTIVNHIDTPFALPDNPTSHKVTLAIPPSVGVAALGEAVSRVANKIRATHEAFRAPEVQAAYAEKGLKWQDWNTKNRDAVMADITKVLTDFGITELAQTQMAYRPRGTQMTPDTTGALTQPLAGADFDPDNIQ